MYYTNTYIYILDIHCNYKLHIAYVVLYKYVLPETHSVMIIIESLPSSGGTSKII